MTASSQPANPSTLPQSATKAADTARRIRETILSASDLPTLPTIAMEVNRLAHSPLSSTSEIVRIVRNDPALTAKILRVANSAFYGMPRRIESLNMALVVLGMREINNLVTCISVFKLFPSRPNQQQFDRQAFWEHSAGCGEIARLLANRLHLRLHGVEFTAGLLHDIGKIVLDQYCHDEFSEAVSLATFEKIPWYEAEQRLLGVDHAEVGAWLSEKWLLPPAITEAIRYHHAPLLSADHQPLAAIVHLANMLTTAVQRRDSRKSFNELLMHDPAWDVLANENPEIISLDTVRFAEELEENLERTREFLRLASS